MRVLIAGAGVIGTEYGAHLGAAGHAVSVLSHPPRTDEIAARLEASVGDAEVRNDELYTGDSLLILLGTA